jgi:hypothetical protein
MTKFGLGVAVIAAITTTSIAAAGPVAAKQRVAITANGVANPTSSGKFVLTPLQAGALQRDSGTETSSLSSQRRILRDGQSVEIVSWVTTLEGKRGSLVIRVRIEQAEAGNGYDVGTGTWKVVRGTGRYAHVTGGGRTGNVWLDRGPWSERREGFLTRS